MKTAFVCSLLAPLAACNPPNEVRGQVDGQSLAVREAIFRKTSAGPIYIHLTDTTNLCQRLGAADLEFLNTTVLTLTLIGPDEDPQVRAGTYPVASTTRPLADGLFIKSDSTGNLVVEPPKGTALGGQVVLDTIDARAGGVAEGSFELNVGVQSDRVSGNFRAVFCDIDQQAPSLR
ncbi:MAG TPA: hypothetical protein VH877_33435 [Polyangia bacterium]|nr:hypothetical protein [Polyangia bacterium]